MRIENVRIEESADRARTVATVIWEDCNRGRQDVYFETEKRFASGLSASPDAFLVAGILPAIRHGERRVAVEGDVCPQLQLGLQTVMQLIRFWWGPGRQPLVIEAGTRSGSSSPQKPERAAFFFTGGVDSLATLRINRLHFDPRHPGYFRDGLLIFGLEVDRLDSFECVTDVLADVAEAADVTLLPVHTNARYLDDDWIFWTDEFEAAVLASTAHALGRRVSSASIGSSFDYPNLHPHGSHPLLDPNYSSSELEIRHDAVGLSRFAKTALLADWDPALRSLRVCNRSQDYRPGIVNCGRCEKCLRTLTALLIYDRLDGATAFAKREVTPQIILSSVELSKTNHDFWAELLEPLERKGRDDLVRAVRTVIGRYHGKGRWKQPIQEFDRQYLNSTLYKTKQALQGLLGAGAIQW